MRKETLEKKEKIALNHIKDVLAYEEKKVVRLEGLVSEDKDGTKNTRWNLLTSQTGVRHLKAARDALNRFITEQL